MALFDPQMLQGSSMSGESFIKRHATPNIAQDLFNLGKGVANIYGEHVIQEGAKKVEDVKKTFLDDLAEVEQLKQERGGLEEQQEELKLAGKAEEAVYTQGKKRIETINQMLESKRLDPFSAQTRVASEIKKMINKAPFLARRIQSEFIEGGRGSQFDTATQTLIDIKNKEMQEVAKTGLDPTDPTQVDLHRAVKRSELEASMLTSQEKIHGVKGGRIAFDYIADNMNVINQQLSNTISVAGGDIDAVSPETREGMVSQAQLFVSNPELIVKNMLTGLEGVSYTQLPQAERTRMVAMVRGMGETIQKTIDGSIPKAVSENLLVAKQNNILNELSVRNPSLFRALTFLQKMPPSIADTALAETVGAGLLKMSENMGLKDYARNGVSDLKVSGIDNPKQVQDSFARNSEDLRREIEIKGDKLDPDFIKNTLENDIGIMAAMNTEPSEYSPKMFDEFINKINSTDYNKVLSKTSPADYEVFRRNGARFVQTYARERLAPSIVQELSKKVFTDFKENSRVYDIVSATVDEGVLTFIPNTGFSTEADHVRAKMFADQLNSKYESRSANIAKAAETLGVTGEEGVQQFSVTILEEPLSMIGEPLRTVSEEIQEPQMTLQQMNRELFRIAQKTGMAPRGVLNTTYRRVADKVLEENLGTERLRDTIRRFRGE